MYSLRARLGKLERAAKNRPDWRRAAVTMLTALSKVWGDGDAQVAEADLPATPAQWQNEWEEIVERVYTTTEEVE